MPDYVPLYREPDANPFSVGNIVNALRGQQVPLPPTKQLDPLLMSRHIFQTPHLYEAWTPFANATEDLYGPAARARAGQYLPEAAGVADPFGATQIQRMLGYPPAPQVQINEAHGLARQENRKHGGW